MERTIRETLDRSLLQIVDGSLAGVIFVVPLLMGGRHALGHLVLTALAVTAAAAWAVQQSLRKNAGWRPTWAMPLLLAGLMLVALQLIPLPPWLLARLSPQMGEILPAWGQRSCHHGIAGTLDLSLADARRNAGRAGHFCGFHFVVLRGRAAHGANRGRGAAAALVCIGGGGHGVVWHRAVAGGEREVLLVLRAPVLFRVGRGEGEFQQSESLCAVSGVGDWAVDLVAARCVAIGAAADGMRRTGGPRRWWATRN